MDVLFRRLKGHGILEATFMYLHWVSQFSLLGQWASSCQVRYFPGDDPDAPMIDRAQYDADLARRCKAVYSYLRNVIVAREYLICGNYFYYVILAWPFYSFMPLI